MIAVEARHRRRIDAVAGLVFAVLVAALGTLGIYAANGAFADDYQLVAVADRAGFGLDSTSDVKVRGITVGGVDSIDLRDDGRVEVVLNIRKELRVPLTARASIEPVSVFGPKYVDLDLGLDEQEGPYLTHREELASVLAPTELGETLQRASVLLDHVDPERLGTTITELARGLDGLGPQLGETLDAGLDLSSRFRQLQPTLDQLLVDASAVMEEIGPRAGRIVDITADARPMLDLLATEGDALASLLGRTGQLSTTASALVADSSGSIDGLLAGLGRGARVMHDHLAHLPAFNAAFRDVVKVLGEDAPRWDLGDGRLGAVTRAIVHLDPCQLAPGALPLCPPVDAP